MQGPTLLDGQWKHTWPPWPAISIHHFLSWFLRPHRPRSCPEPCPRSLAVRQSVGNRGEVITRTTYFIEHRLVSADVFPTGFLYYTLPQVEPWMLSNILVSCISKEDYQNTEVNKQPAEFYKKLFLSGKPWQPQDHKKLIVSTFRCITYIINHYYKHYCEFCYPTVAFRTHHAFTLGLCRLVIGSYIDWRDDWRLVFPPAILRRRQKMVDYVEKDPLPM